MVLTIDRVAAKSKSTTLYSQTQVSNDVIPVIGSPLITLAKGTRRKRTVELLTYQPSTRCELRDFHLLQVAGVTSRVDDRPWLNMILS